MKNRVIKLIVCILIISCMMVGFCTSYASAELPIRSAMQRFNAWIASAIVAGNITIGSTVAPVQSLLDTLQYGAGMPWTPQYTYQGANWDDELLDKATIYVRPDVVEIDGVKYSEVIISEDASQKFRVNAYDLQTAWNIASNSNGTYASGSGFLQGIPIYNSSSWAPYIYRSQPLAVSGNGYVGDLVISNYSQSGSRAYATFSAPGGYQFNRNWLPASETPIIAGSSTSDVKFRIYNGSSFFGGDDIGRFDPTPFEFDWVSGNLVPETLPPGSQLTFHVPSQHSDSTHSDTEYNIPELVTNYPEYGNPDGYTFEFDPDLNPDFNVDINASNALGNLISAIIAAYLAGLIDTPSTTINYTKNEPEPHPGVIDPLPDPDPAPDDPVAGTTIANTDWTKLDEILRWIQSTIDSLRHLTESLQTMLDSIWESLQDLLQTFQTIPQQILEDIETGPSKVFRKALDILKSLFLPLLLPIKAMMGLWHYVVEWLASINTPFLWIFGVMSGTSSNMVLPIYAVLAGSICIAIYKALGR